MGISQKTFQFEYSDQSHQMISIFLLSYNDMEQDVRHKTAVNKDFDNSETCFKNL